MVRYQGGGHKQRYRLIDFKRRKFDQPAVVERLEYDPNRTGFIALIKYKDGELACISRRSASPWATPWCWAKGGKKPGNAMPFACRSAPWPTISK